MPKSAAPRSKAKDAKPVKKGKKGEPYDIPEKKSSGKSSKKDKGWTSTTPITYYTILILERLGR